MSGAICGGAPPLGTVKTNDIDQPYHVLVRYPFTWRVKLGKVECDCEWVREWYQPWYGTTWLHSDDCAIMKHYRRWPQMENFMWDRDVTVIVGTDAL